MVQARTAGRAGDRRRIRLKSDRGNGVDPGDRAGPGRDFSRRAELAVRRSAARGRLGTEIGPRVVQLDILAANPAVDIASLFVIPSQSVTSCGMGAAAVRFRAGWSERGRFGRAVDHG